MGGFSNTFDPGALRKIGQAAGYTVGAGLVGENQQVSIPSTSAIALASETDTILGTLTITPGWYVSTARLSLICDVGTTLDYVAFGYSTGGTLSVASNAAVMPLSAVITEKVSTRYPTFRNLVFPGVSADQTNNLIARVRFSGGNVSAYGTLTFKRIASA